MSKAKDWYRRRTYSHFDRPLSREQAQTLVESPEAVARHAFWPVIINPQKTVSIKKDPIKGDRVYHTKSRPIAFSAHSDAHIYAYYAQKLNEKLEAVYEELDGAPHVLAYRQFEPAKSNIHFAFDAFKEIRDKKECDVIAIDVEGFFDGLDHQVLKSAWSKLLGETYLPKDHYTVYRACTHDSAITVPVLRDLFGGEIRRRAGREGQAICTPKEFRSVVKPHLRSRHELVWKVKRKTPPVNKTGIPQGLPISAVLANLYMFEPDNEILQSIKELGGSYRRYSDDILLILPKGKGKQGESIIKDALKKVNLNIQPKKTKRNRFIQHKGELKSFELDEHYTLGVQTPASYLGFSFDGQNIRVRNSTVSRFMIKAKRAIERAEIAANKNKTGYIKKRQLYARLTSIGYGNAYGKGIYNSLSDGVLPKGAPRLGFFKYLKLAHKVMGSETIAKQARQIENQVFREIAEANSRIRGESV